MLTYNLDTSDGLTNGARGKILDFCKNKSGEVTTIIVQFEDETVGKEKRNQNPSVKTKYPGMLATPIEKMEFEYSLSKKAYSTSSTAKTISVARMGGGKKSCGQFLDFQRFKALASVIFSEKVPV